MGFIKEWGLIAGLAGLALGSFFVLFREVIRKNIFSTLTKKQSYIIIIVFMILVWSLSIFAIIEYYHTGSGSDLTAVTVLVHGEKGIDEMILPNRGQVKLIYGGIPIVETLNAKSEATFTIPSKYFRSKETVKILFYDPDGEPYRAKNPDSLYKLQPNENLYLEVKLFGLDKIWGVIEDIETEKPIPDARISIQGAVTFSNEYGEYTLLIPKEFQEKKQTVRATKEGYKTWTLNVPIQTNRELPIKMTPINNEN